MKGGENKLSVNINKLRLPITFESDSSIEDSRFKKVKVWIAHTGENLNNSYFEKSTLSEMAKTLSGIPILGFVEVDSDDENDFSDHRQEITIKDGDVDIRYAGHAYGFIPKENNHDFEFRDGKEWLTAEGILWSKFTDAMNIFDESSGIKSQSMEIRNVEATTDDIGRIDIHSAVFDGLCILGDKVSPAMAGSTIEFFSNNGNEYQLEVEKLMTAFELEKGAESVAENEEVLEVETELDLEEDVEKEEFEADTEVEVEEETIIDEEEKDDSVEDFEEEAEEEVVIEEPEVAEEKAFKVFNLNFELSHSEISNKLYRAVDRYFGDDHYGYVSEIFDDYAIVQVYDGDSSWYSKMYYSKDEDSINITSDTKVFSMFLTEEEKTKVENHRARIEELEEELKALNEYKAQIEQEEKEALLEEFSEKVEAEDLASIREKVKEFSVEDIEKELGLALFRFEKRNKSEETSNAVIVTNFNKNK